MKRVRKLMAIAILAAVIGVITVGPAMADKDSAPGQDKTDICHYDKEDGEYKMKTISQKAADKHVKNHPNDIILESEEECPDQGEEVSVDSIDLEMLLGMFTEIVIFEQEVDNLQSQIDKMNGEESENLIFRHVTDQDGTEWNPNSNTRNFFITDEVINANSVVSITIILPIGTDVDDISNCVEQLVEMSDGSYLLGINCSSQLPESTQLNYVVMNPTL